MAKRSQTVDNKIRQGWAKLASVAFKGAIAAAELGSLSTAQSRMEWVESWLDRAGAQASKCGFYA